ncbi:hypothetical protein HY224_02595, partial [Candidatus Uhrbacteria bacterium]|nr:hypothetical protein [Candidatus Uhrbacteria bacterium]
MTKNKILTAVILLALGGLLGSQWQAKYDASYIRILKSGQQNVAVKPVTVMIDNGLDVPVVLGPMEPLPNQNLFDLTEKLAEDKKLKFDFKDFGELGYLVTQIGEQKNGTDNHFWQYWVG